MLSPFEGLSPMMSLHIMDLKQKKVITTFDSIGRSPNFTLAESPWLRDGYRFVYNISEGPEIKSAGKIINPVKKDSAGIYLYDLGTGVSKMLVPGGKCAIASPVSNQIAYLTKNSIEVLDLDSKERRVIYKFGDVDQINDMHWTPDGKYIYCARIKSPTKEMLIEIGTGKKIRFKKLGLGFNYYTWK